jgi:hypothetical protein
MREGMKAVTKACKGPTEISIPDVLDLHTAHGKIIDNNWKTYILM